MRAINPTTEVALVDHDFAQEVAPTQASKRILLGRVGHSELHLESQLRTVIQNSKAPASGALSR